MRCCKSALRTTAARRPGPSVASSALRLSAATMSNGQETLLSVVIVLFDEGENGNVRLFYLYFLRYSAAGIPCLSLKSFVK